MVLQGHSLQEIIIQIVAKAQVIQRELALDGIPDILLDLFRSAFTCRKCYSFWGPVDTSSAQGDPTLHAQLAGNLGKERHVPAFKGLTRCWGTPGRDV